MAWLSGLEPWLANLIIGLWIVALMAFASIAVVRMGRSPLWVLALLVPYLNVGVIWYLALTRWPRIDGPDPR